VPSAGPPGWRRLRTGHALLVVDPDFEAAARQAGLLAPDALQSAFAAPAGATGRAPTAIVSLPGRKERLLLRRLRHGGLLGPLLGASFLGLARALAELRVTAALREAGAPVPRPVLALGRRRVGPLFECAVATVLEEGALDALAFLESAPEPARVLRAARAAGEAVRRLHDAGGRHADLHVKNLLIREQGELVECRVVDLDRARLEVGLTPAERIAQLARLWRSLLKRGVLARVGARGCARFLGAYCGDDRALRRALWRHQPRERRRTALHTWRYRRAG
jgi:hypothetical protein